MNSLLIYPHELRSSHDAVVARPRELEHLQRIIKNPQKIKITLLNQGIGYARVASINQSECVLEQIELTPHGKKPWAVLFVALSRPLTMKKIIEHGTTMGVKEFIFYRAEKSEKSYAQSKILDLKELQSLCELGLQQSTLYYEAPKIHVLPNHLDQLIQSYPLKNRFILDLGTRQNFAQYFNTTPAIHSDELAICAFGPESGFTDDDLRQFKQHHFQSISISSTVLRLEHAVYYTLGQLELFRSKP